MSQVIITAKNLKEKNYTEAISKAFAYGMYLLLFVFVVALPSVVMPELMHPTQTGKFFFFTYALMGVVVLFVLHKLFGKQPWVLRISSIDTTLGVIFLYIIINRYLIHDIWGFSLRFYELIGLVVLYVILRQLDRKIYVWLLLAVIVSGIIQAVYGSLQLWGYFPSHHSGFRMTGSFFNPGPYAGFLAGIFPVSVGMYLFRNRFQDFVFPVSDLRIAATDVRVKGEQINRLINLFLFEYLPLVGIFSILIVLPASQSRAAWLAVIISGIFLMSIRYSLMRITLNMLNTRSKKVLACLILLVSIGGGAFGLYHFKKGSADGRLLIWKVTTDMIMDHPWTGVGYDRFKAHYMNYQADYFREHGETGEEMVAGESLYAFNELLQFISEQGIIGVVLLIAFVAIIMTSLIKRRQKDTMVVLSGLLSMLIFGMFSYPAEILPIKMCMVLCLAVLASKVKVMYHRNFVIEPYLKGLFSILFIGMLGATATAGEGLRKACQDWQTAYNTYQFGLYEESITEYEKLYPVFKISGEYLMNYGKALSMAELHVSALKVLEEARNHYSSTIIQITLGDSHKATKDYKKAEFAYWNASQMIPSRFYPKYLLAKLYHESGNEVAARRVATSLLKAAAKINSPAIKEIKTEMSQIISFSNDQAKKNL